MKFCNEKTKRGHYFTLLTRTVISPRYHAVLLLREKHEGLHVKYVQRNQFWRDVIKYWVVYLCLGKYLAF